MRILSLILIVCLFVAADAKACNGVGAGFGLGYGVGGCGGVQSAPMYAPGGCGQQAFGLGYGMNYGAYPTNAALLGNPFYNVNSVTVLRAPRVHHGIHHGAGAGAGVRVRAPFVNVGVDPVVVPSGGIVNNNVVNVQQPQRRKLLGGLFNR